MKRHGLLCAVLLLTLTAGAADLKQYLVRLAEDESFTVAETKTWNVQLVHAQPLVYADIKITPKVGNPFSVMLYFKSDTHAMANYDTPEKMKAVITYSSQTDLQRTGEKELRFQSIDYRGRYGFYTVITHAVPPQLPGATGGPFKFTTRGMVRLTTDAALGFTLRTHALNIKEYQELLDYILGFVQPAG
ncbi:MAG: hypothetical protein EPN23_10300 [Verrucomicrobia bacterium]|nr:MAG: hypothetical protein EPN23_10300 [Verrucomicrobiota bacterium]